MRERHFRILYVIWVEFGTKCGRLFRVLYVIWVDFGTKCGKSLALISCDFCARARALALRFACACG
ncbi:hypothetical protein HMPREF3216_01021 [Gardnerella vaginalis]|uniref:Uncharacterized protein n=1 Tax=Gardnerella vaginalis TaxID=2702 RepID=A0A133NN00_GARVA|nr:hypothetical protein HMPREF3216_01021 [Gardnerella vaginalis]